MNRSKVFILNTFFAASNQMVVFIVGFIVPHYMLKYYGSEINGLLSSITQFIGYFNIVEAGLSGAAIYSLYKPLAESNYKEISCIVVATRNFYYRSGVLFLGLLLILSIIYPTQIKVDGISNYEMTFLIIILGMSGILEFFTLGKYRAILTADQKLYIISIASIIYQVINTAIFVFLAVNRVGIFYLKLFSMSAIFIRCFILYYFCRKQYYYIDYFVCPNYKALNKRWDALFLQVLGVIHSGSPIILATIFTNLKQVSVYTINNMIIGGIQGIIGIFTNGLSSSFGDIIARNQKETLKRAYTEFEFAFYSLITIIYSVSMVMLIPFVKIYTGSVTDINYADPKLGFLFVLNAFLYDIKIPQGMLIISAGQYRETRVQTTLQGLIAILGGILLAPKFGLYGILSASVISNLYRAIDLLFYVPKHITSLSVSQTLKHVWYIPMQFLVIVFSGFCFIRDVNNYMQWFFSALYMTAYSVVIVGLTGIIFNRKEVYHIMARLRGIIVTNYDRK